MTARTHTTSRFLAALCFFTCLGLLGCGKGKGNVSGTVNLSGKPLKAGVVTFVSTEGGPSFTASINEDGTYTATDVLAGNYKVCVATGAPQPGGGASKSAPSSSSSLKGKAAPGGPPDLVALAKAGKIKTSGSESPEGKTPDAMSVLLQNSAAYVPIPSHYAQPETTDLTYTATSGPQTFPIDLKGP